MEDELTFDLDSVGRRLKTELAPVEQTTEEMQCLLRKLKAAESALGPK